MINISDDNDNGKLCENMPVSNSPSSTHNNAILLACEILAHTVRTYKTLTRAHVKCSHVEEKTFLLTGKLSAVNRNERKKAEGLNRCIRVPSFFPPVNQIGIVLILPAYSDLHSPQVSVNLFMSTL